MTAGGACPARRIRHEPEGDVPFPEFGAVHPQEMLAVRCVGLVAETAGPSFSLVGHMEVVEVFLAVPELRVKGRLRKRNEILFVALETEVVGILALFERNIQCFRIFPLEKFQVGSAMRVVARRAPTLPDRTMNRFLAGQYRNHLGMASETEILTPLRKKRFHLGRMAAMTGEAAF